MICHARNPYRRPCPPREGGRLSARTVVAAALAAIVVLSPVPAVAAVDGPVRTPEQVAIERAARSPWPEFSACVSWRESHGNPRARNPEAGSTAQGRWQFINRDWQESLPYMVAKRLKHFGYPARKARELRKRLQRKEIARWPGLMQDIGHAAVLVAGIRGEGQGWLHWKGGKGCNALVGR